MTQLNFPATTGKELSLSLGKTATRQGGTEIPLLALIKDCYLLWHNFLPHLPRLSRYTLGVKIDQLFIELIEITFTAKYAKRAKKLNFLEELSRKLDNLKFFITLLFEAKGLKAAHYGQLSQKLATAGKMTGKWLELFKKETPAD